MNETPRATEAPSSDPRRDEAGRVDLRRFLALAGPNVLANLMVPLAGLVDTALLGHLPQMQALAGVGLAGVVFDYLYWSFGFLRMGTTGVTAQAVGAGDDDEATLTLARAGLLALCLGLLILVLAQPIEALAFWILDGTAAVEAMGREYFAARIWGAPFTLLNFALLGWFLGRGRVDKVLWMSLVANAVNIALDWWFIRELGWGSAGAGWATAASQLVACVWGISSVGPRQLARDLRRLRPRIRDAAALRRLASLSGDILVRTFALLTAFALFTNYSAALSTLALTANTVLLKALSTAAFFIDGYAYATETMAGWAAGRKDAGALRRLLRIALPLGVVTGLIFGACFWAFPELFGLLTDHGEVLDEVAAQSGWLLAVLAFSGAAYIFDGYFLGLAAGKRLRRAMIWSLLLGFWPLAAWARYGGLGASAALDLLWAAMVLFMFARSLSLGVAVPKTLKFK